VVLHPDSRRAVLSSGFSFNEVRRLSLGDLDGVVTFRVERGKRIWPEVLGDLDGDGVEEYALRSGDKGDTPGGGGTTYLVHGGTTWSGDIPEDILASHSVHFVTGGNNPPWLLPLGDLNHDGKDDCAVASPYSNYRGAGEFAVVFDTPPIGDEVDFNSLAGDPDAAYFSSTAALGFDVRNAGDFDGDGVEDLVTFSVRTFFSDEPPRIFLIFGPIARGERVDLDASGKVLIISDAK